MKIKTPSSRQIVRKPFEVRTNKVVLGKWMPYRSPKYSFWTRPTRGIDVGAKYEII